jgi:signal transduction histidine kinase
MSGRESVRIKLQDRASVFLSFVLIIPIVSLIILSAFFSKKIFYNTNSKILNGLLVELNNKEQDEFSKLNIEASRTLKRIKNYDNGEAVSFLNDEDVAGYFYFNNGDIVAKNNLLNRNVVCEIFKENNKSGYFMNSSRIYRLSSIIKYGKGIIILKEFNTKNLNLSFLQDVNFEIIQLKHNNKFDYSFLKNHSLNKNELAIYENNKEIGLYSLISDIFGQPLGVIQISLSKTLFTSLYMTYWIIGIFIIALSIILSLIYARYVANFLMSPVERISFDMDKISQNPINSEYLQKDRYPHLELMVEATNKILESFRKHYTNQKKYEEIVWNIKEGIFEADAQGIINLTNPILKKILNTDCIKGKNIFDIFKINHTEIPIKAKEYYFNNRYYHLFIDKFTLQKKLYYSGILIDISQQKNDEKAKLALKLELEKKSKLAELGLLIEGISHNLNSPLNNIMGYTQLIKRKYPDDLDFEKIMKNGERMTDIIKSLMLRMNNQIQSEKQKININELVNAEISYWNHNLFFKNNINKEIILDKSIPFFYGFYGDINQALTNLISNSFDAIKNQEERKIIIKTSQNDEFILISVQDNGPGISNDNLGKIFDSFFSTKTSINKISRGLGLSFSKQSIENLGGKLECTSGKKNETKFTIYLPINRTDVQ